MLPKRHNWCSHNLKIIYNVELQSELWHALDVLIDKRENCGTPFQSNVKSIVAYVDALMSKISKSTFVSRLNGILNSSNDRWAYIWANILYVNPKLLIATHHYTMLNVGCDCGVFYFIVFICTFKRTWS